MLYSTRGLLGFNRLTPDLALLAWLVVYAIIARGLHSSGKIIWFTALFPYFVMLILLFRAITLDGRGP